ncbi:hypothetical protein G3I26_03910, partial [Streptomyces sp. SID7909]|nr:hypothetical protein [Streptomyces sp. SID7909]
MTNLPDLSETPFSDLLKTARAAEREFETRRCKSHCMELGLCSLESGHTGMH